MKFLFAMVLTLGSFAAQADFSADPVTTLANFTVGQSMKRYSVRVRNCADSISSIMLRVQDAGIEINGAGVSYTDGSVDQYSLSYTFPAEYDSPWLSIDSFKEAGKCVKSVFVNARSTDANRNSRVRVFGN